MTKWVNEKDELERLINIEHVAYEEIGRKYGVTGAAVKKAAQRLGIETPQKRKINPSEHFNRGTAKTATCPNCGNEFIVYASTTGKYCSHKCHMEHKHKIYIDKWKRGEVDGITGTYMPSDHIRRYMLERADYKCEKCGWCETNEFHPTPPLQLHHIDGDCLNNKEENLIILCPNCHAMTENYGSKNKNGLKARTDYFGKGKDAYDKRKTLIEELKK